MDRHWSYGKIKMNILSKVRCVNALSGLYLISTKEVPDPDGKVTVGCQCPFGLIPHFYETARWGLDTNWRVSMPFRAYTSFLQDVKHMNCVLKQNRVNALSGLYLISTYPFKNLGFMRFPEPVFAGIYQNILTTTVFRAC